MPGMYQFPIQFQLPPGLPGVFFDKRRESDGDDIKAAIMYKVKVSVRFFRFAKPSLVSYFIKMIMVFILLQK